jgi:hypothetical protein
VRLGERVIDQALGLRMKFGTPLSAATPSGEVG